MKLLTSALVLTLSLLSTAWAQTGKPMALAQLAAYNKPDREKVLYAGAKAEGKITWYTSLAGASYKKLAAAFEAHCADVPAPDRAQIHARVAEMGRGRQRPSKRDPPASRSKPIAPRART